MRAKCQHERVYRTVKVQHWKGKGLKAVLCTLVLSATVYNLWGERNNIKHGHQLMTEERIIQKVRWEVRTRVLPKGCFKRSKENEALCDNWDVLGEYFEG